MSETTGVHLGDPCPNGCTEGPSRRKQEPVILVESLPGSGDGCIYCSWCWDGWVDLAIVTIPEAGL